MRIYSNIAKEVLTESKNVPQILARRASPKRLLICFLALLMASCAHRVQIYNMREGGMAVEVVKIEKPSEDMRVGEQLTYAVDWIGIPSGYFTIEVKEISYIRNRRTYHVISKSAPNKFFRFFYDVEYVVHTYIDTQSLNPVKYEKKRIAKNGLTVESIDFYYDEGKVVWKHTDPVATMEMAIPEQPPQDLMSALYYFRHKDFKVGTSHLVNIIYRGKFWPMDVSIDRLTYVEIFNRTKELAFVISPQSSLNRRITGFNTIEIYFSMDKLRLPLFFKMRTKIGQIKGVLINQPNIER